MNVSGERITVHRGRHMWNRVISVCCKRVTTMWMDISSLLDFATRYNLIMCVASATSIVATILLCHLYVSIWRHNWIETGVVFEYTVTLLTLASSPLGRIF